MKANEIHVGDQVVDPQGLCGQVTQFPAVYGSFVGAHYVMLFGAIGWCPIEHLRRPDLSIVGDRDLQQLGLFQEVRV